MNSFHNFKIIKSSKKFLDLGFAEDNSIELSISTDQLFLGLMFHPERKNHSQKKINKLILNWFSR